jgi:acyl-ACP thioesterase
MPSTLFCFLQESAWRHANSKDFGWERLAERNEYWILAKVHVQINRMPKWPEKIRCETWGKAPELLTAFRDYEFFDANHQPVIRATSSWHILDMQTHRPKTLTTFADDFPVVDRQAIADKPQKIKPPASDCERSTVFTVHLSDLDLNMHVNNTKYVQWAIDCIPFDFQEQHQLHEINVNFLSQSSLGETYFIETYQNNLTFTHFILSEKDSRKLAAVQSVWNKRE